MLVSEILNKEYRLCDLDEREKSVIYKEINIDSLIFKNVVDNESDYDIVMSVRREINE